MTVTVQEKERLRELAAQWMEAAEQPIMKERKRLWKAVKDLKMEKPVILVETCMLEHYIMKEELVCTDPYLRNIEKSLFEVVRHAEEIGDDIVLDPYYQIPWVIELSDYGADMEPQHAETSSGDDLGYSFEFGVRSEEDIDKLHLRRRVLDREGTAKQKALLEDIFGDILPVRVGGYDWFNKDPGYHPWLGNLYCGLTMDLFKMVGNDNLLLWVYDKPEWVHKMMRLIRDDRFEYIQKRIPNLRAVSVSGWSDFYKCGEQLGKDYVYSRKPVPAYISGANPDWELITKDIADTLKGAKDCNLEFAYRDIYTTNGDRKRLTEWVQLVRKMMGE